MLAIKTTETPVADKSSAWLDNFINIYLNLSVDNLSNLEHLYHQDIIFQDPLHKITGFGNLADYFAALYQNVSSCRFVITQIIQEGDQAAVYWTMTYQHKQLNGGKEIEVEGHSLLKGRGEKVIYHRDYLDLGQMLYEHIPFLGRVIRLLKKRVSK